MTINVMFLCYLLIAALTDVFFRKVKNQWIAAGVLFACLIRPFETDRIKETTTEMICTASITLALLMPLYQLRMLGAGDVKLFAVTALFLRPDELLLCVFWTFVIALLYGLGKGCIDHSNGKRLEKLKCYLLACYQQGRILPYPLLEDKRQYLPLAVFVFIGVCVVWRKDIEALLCSL